MNTMLPLQNGDPLIALRGFLRQLLETGVVEAIYLPLEVDGGATLPALVTDPAWLDQADPLTPVMPINSARAVSTLTNKQSPARLGVVLRPCEIRALIELFKFQQATLEGVTLIGLDCPGTYEVADFTVATRLALCPDAVRALPSSRAERATAAPGSAARGVESRFP